MKNKQLMAVFVSLILIFVMAGCSNSNNSGQANAASNGNGNGNSANGFTKPDVYGEVSSINGNNVTLKLMEIPQMPNRNGQGNGGGNGQGNGGNWQNGGGNGQGNGGNGSNGGNGGFRGGNGGGGGFGGMRQRNYTGQTKTITIPSGTSLVTMARGQNGMTQNQIKLSDVTVGSVFSIYYKSDGKTIDKIRVMQPRTGGQGNWQGGQGNGQNNGQSNGQGGGQGNGQGTSASGNL